MSSILYVCPECMGFCKSTEHGKQIKCPKCRSIQLIEAGLQGDEWMSMSAAGRREYLDGITAHTASDIDIVNTVTDLPFEPDIQEAPETAVVQQMQEQVIEPVSAAEDEIMIEPAVQDIQEVAWETSGPAFDTAPEPEPAAEPVIEPVPAVKKKKVVRKVVKKAAAAAEPVLPEPQDEPAMFTAPQYIPELDREEEPAYTQEPETEPEPIYNAEPAAVPEQVYNAEPEAEPAPVKKKKVVRKVVKKAAPVPEPVYAPEPEFIPEPVYAPEPVIEPEQEYSPAPETEFGPVYDAVPEAIPEQVYSAEPEAEPAPVKKKKVVRRVVKKAAPAPEPVYIPEPVIEPEPVYVPEPVIEPEPVYVQAPVIEPEVVLSQEPEPEIHAPILTAKKKKVVRKVVKKAAPEPEPVYIPEPEIVPEPEYVPEPVIEPEPEAEPEAVFSSGSGAETHAPILTPKKKKVVRKVVKKAAPEPEYTQEPVIEPEPEAEPEAAFSREPEPETHAPILTAKKKKVVRKVVKKPSSEAAAEEPAAEGVSEAPSEEAATEPGIKTYDTSEGGDTGETSADKHDGEAKKEDDWKSDLGAEAAAAVDEESEADEEPVGKPKWKKVKVDATPEARRNRIIVYATSIGMVTALTVTTMVIPSFRFRDEMSVLRSSQVGDIVSYGKYKGNTDWIVLDKQPDRVLCISDFEVGDTRDDEIFWETSPVREELNSTFMNSTFNLYERIRILSADTIRQQDPEYTTAYVTKDMDDKVFILKDSELKNYISDNSDRMVQLSDMAVHPAMWVDIK